MDNLNLIDKGIELNNSTNDLSLDEIMENDYVPSNLDIDNNNEITSNLTHINAIDSDNSTEPSEEECTALVTIKPNSLWVAQTMFRKSIKISIKSFLISLSLGFLNLFF